MSRFRSDGRTIATQVKSHLTDIFTKQSVFNHSTSSKLSVDRPFINQDIVLSQTVSHIIPKTYSVFCIQCPEPIQIQLYNAQLQHVTMTVTGLYVHHGASEGQIILTGLNTTTTRCSLFWS